MNHKLIDIVEQKYKKAEPPKFQIGDTVDVHTRIVEGDKERVQVFTGVVIARRGRGLGEMFTVRRIVANEGVERVIPVQSPRILKVEVRRHGKVRRAKLYYLRERVGKSRRLRERRIGKGAGGGKAVEPKESATVGMRQHGGAEVEVAGQPA